MVERFIGTKRFGSLELVVVARRHPGRGAEQLRDLHRGQRHAAPDPPDENVVPALHARARDDHTPRGECREREAGRDVPWNRVGDDAHVRRGHHDVLSDRARQVLAEELVAYAQRVLAAYAVFAGAIGDPRVDDDTIAPTNALDRGPDLVDDAGAVATHDPGRRNDDPGKAFDHEQIEVIERRVPEPNAHITGSANGGLRDIASILQ